MTNAVSRLITEWESLASTFDPETNTVLGVQVGEGDKAVRTLRQNKGVIMATGGITGTPESLDSWVPSVAGKGV